MEEEQVHKSVESKIDIKKPLIPQVKNLSNKEFLAFVRRPRHMESTDGIILYEDKAQDDAHKSCRDWNYNVKIILPLCLAAIIGAYFDCDSISQYIQTILIWFTLGLGVMWTFMEYF